MLVDSTPYALSVTPNPSGITVALTAQAHRPDPFDTSPAGNAARYVPHNPHPLCRDFTPKPAPSAFWCVTCNWNEPMHEDDRRREAIAAELTRLSTAPKPPVVDHG